MAINMTQALTFETDDLDSFGLMLESSIHVLFPKTKGHCINFHIKTNEPSSWEDGKYENYHNDAPPIINLESYKYALLEHDRTYGGAFFLKKGEVIVGKDAAAQASVAKRTKPKPKRLWIATLSDYASDFSSEDISCTNHKNFVKKAMEIVEKFPKDRVFDELGSGRHCGFNSFDGSIDVAYRMQWAPMGGWNLLHLSATHAYYGK